MFEVVDPARLLVEAVVADPALAASFGAAELKSMPGYRLTPVGAARALRDGVLPVTFRATAVASGAAPLAVGQAVTVIARLNTPYGETGGWPWYHLLMMKNGVPIPVHSDGPSQYTLLHQRDIIRTLPGLVAAARVPALVVNWCGREHVSIEEWCTYLGELTGLEPKFERTERTLQSVMTDDARMRALVGPAEVPWTQGLREMVEALAPELLR